MNHARSPALAAQVAARRDPCIFSGRQRCRTGGQYHQLAALGDKVQSVGAFSVIAAQVAANDMDDLRSMADMTCDKLDTGVVVLAAVNEAEGKVSLVVKASKAAVAAGAHAGKVIKEAAKLVGGGGGGRPDMAQAGGKNPAGAEDALAKAVEILASQSK